MDKLLINAFACNGSNVQTEMIDGREHRIIKRVRAAELDSVMNGLEYPSSAFTVDAVNSLKDKLAPYNHPQGKMREAISSLTSWAINRYHVGAFVLNAYIEDKFLLTDIAVDVELAKKHEKGVELLERVNKLALNGEPIGVSTGVKYRANGNVIEYMEFDHLAILPTGTKPAGKNTFALLTNAQNEQESNEMTPEQLRTALNEALKPLQDKINTLETQLATNSNKELEGKKAAVKAHFGLDEIAINAMNETAIDAFYAKTVGAAPVTTGEINNNQSLSAMNKLLENK